MDTQEAKPQGPPATVLVLGGGMSGLVAAYELMRSGFNVQVFEGREVAGGRVHTQRNGFSSGHYAEAGAMFLPTGHDLTFAYAKLFNLPLEGFANSELPSLYYLKGERIVFQEKPPPDAPPIVWPYRITPLEEKIGLTAINRAYCDTAGFAKTAINESWPSVSEGTADQITFDTRMRGLGASEGAIELQSSGYLSMYGEGPTSYSALFMLCDEWYTQNVPKAVQVKGGNDLLPKALGASLGDRIHYGATVLSIDCSHDKVRVTVSSNGSQEVVEGDYAVCALPFTIVRDLPVTPALSPLRRQAFYEIPCTSATRVSLEFNNAFWVDEGLQGLAISDLNIGITFPQTNQPPPGAVLSQLIVGADARNMASRSEDERVEFTLDQMSKFYPQARANFSGRAISKVWDSDPFSKGAYAFYRPGQMTAYLRLLQMPEGRLYFAGDYTTRLPGWIEGAVTSGQRVASDIAIATGRTLALRPAQSQAAGAGN